LIFIPNEHKLEVPGTVNISYINYSINKNLSLHVGEQFKYEEKFFERDFKDAILREIIVDEEDLIRSYEKINGKEYVCVDKIINGTLESVNFLGVYSSDKNGSYTRTYCYNSVGQRKKMLNKILVDDEMDDNDFFAFWMLGLEKNKRFEIRFKTNENRTITWRFNVLGIENINAIQCFKVEKKDVYEDIESNEYQVYWIDAEKRTLVKVEKYYNKTKTFEKDLII